MNGLTQENIGYIATEMHAISMRLNKKMINNALEANIALEQLLTLDALETCLATHSDDDPIARSSALVHLLAERWERIRHSPLNYTKRPSDPVNQLCFSIASQIAPLPDNEDELNRLLPGQGPYFLIMPSLTACRDASGTNIHHFALHQFVLSDHQNLFIPVENCLLDAMDSDTGKLKHMVSDPEGRYSLKIVHFNEPAGLHDDEIPANELWLYLQDGMIHCAAKNKDRFVLSEEELVGAFDEPLDEEEKQRLYANIKRALTPPQKNTLALNKDRQGDIFCHYLKSGVSVPVRVKLDDSCFGTHAQDINNMLSNPGEKRPTLSMLGDDIVCSVKSVTGECAQVKLDDDALFERAASIREALQQSVPKKALTIEEESAIFRSILSKGYRREQQDFADLTENEAKQVIHHSSLTENYHKAIELVQALKNGFSLGSALWSLYKALGSGVHRGGAANAEANEGIAVFSNHWNTYSTAEKTSLYALYPDLLTIIKDLNLNPKERYQEHCIGIIASRISSLLDKHPAIYNTKPINKAHHRERLALGMAKTNYQLFDNSPNRPLDASLLATLSPAFFKKAYTLKILRYAIEQEESLSVGLLSLWPLLTDLDKQHCLHLTNAQGDTALIRATSCQDIAVVSYLIDATPVDFIDVKNNRGETALMRTVMNKKTGAAIAERLIQAGATINSKNKYGETAVTLAVRHNNLEVLHVLIQLSQDPLLTRNEALRFAIIHQSPMLETLRHEASALPIYAIKSDEFKSDDRFITAIKKGNLAEVSALIEEGADINAFYSSGKTALIIAIENKQLKIAMLLLSSNADIRHVKTSDANAFDLAQSQAPDFDAFIDPLLLKALSLHLNEQKWLLSKTKHRHVLDYVFQRKAALMPQFLEEITKINDPTSRYSILNARDQHGNTLLHMAVKDALQTGRTRMVAQLIQAGVDANIKNANGHSPLTLAQAYPLNDGLSTITDLLNSDAQTTAPLPDGVETVTGMTFNQDVKIQAVAIEQRIQPANHELLTEQSIKDHIDIIEKCIYAFPKDSTISVREPLILALSGLFDSNAIRTNHVLFEKITEPLSSSFDNPALSGVNEADHEKFREIMKNTVNKAILFLRTMTDDQLEQFIDEKWAEHRRSDRYKKIPVDVPLPQDPFEEALDDLNVTLQNKTYARQLKEAGQVIRDGVIEIRRTIRDEDALKRLLIVTNASIKDPSIKHVEACSMAIQAVDDNNHRLKVALLIFAGIALAIVIVGAIAMSFGAFSAIGIPALGLLVKAWTIALAPFSALAIGMKISDNEGFIDGDPNMNRTRCGFFQLEQAMHVINKEPPNEPYP